MRLRPGDGLGRRRDEDHRGSEVEADWKDLESAETYLGYERTQGFASPGGLAPKKRQLYASSRHLGSNQCALAGDRTVDADRVHLNERSGRIDFSSMPATSIS